jgi:glycerate 2-kinase
MSVEIRKAVAGARGIRRDVLAAVEAALKAADPRSLVRRELKLRGSRLTARSVGVDLERFRRVVVVGGGKASGLMAVEAERILGDRIDEGVVVVPGYQKGLPHLKKVRFERSTHPLPSEKGARAVKKVLKVLEKVGAEDLVIVLLSGGCSAMMPAPPEGITVKELERTTNLLLKAGADIRETNCVRKHLSQIAGGRLVERARGAEVLALVISDVVGDDLGTIASGPTVPDPTTFADARAVLERRKIWRAVPAAVREAITTGVSGAAEETPKPGSRIFERVENLVIGSNADACAAARASLESRGYGVVLRTQVTGEARQVGRDLAGMALSGGASHWAAIWGGETTVTVKGRGTGGRNQEVALAAAVELRGSSRVVIASVGTDGVDGPTKAAGAMVDGTTIERGRLLGLDASRSLDDNDSNSYFRALGDLVVTGPTGTNVNDLMIAARG